MVGRVNTDPNAVVVNLRPRVGLPRTLLHPDDIACGYAECAAYGDLHMCVVLTNAFAACQRFLSGGLDIRCAALIGKAAAQFRHHNARNFRRRFPGTLRAANIRMLLCNTVCQNTVAEAVRGFGQHIVRRYL